MKKAIILTLIASISIIMNLCFVSAQEWGFSIHNQNIYNRSLLKVLDTNYNWTPIDMNPIEVWIWHVIIWEDETNPQISWLVGTDQEITEYSDAMRKILKVVQNVVNYFLWLLWVVALIYLIIHGLMILTAAGDDSKMKKWLKWVKNAFIAIAGIWLSRLIISFILRIINTITA